MNFKMITGGLMIAIPLALYVGAIVLIVGPFVALALCAVTIMATALIVGGISLMTGSSSR